MEPESCRKLEEHVKSVGDYNLRGQLLTLQCQIDKTDFSNENDVYYLRRKSLDVGTNIIEIVSFHKGDMGMLGR